MEKKERDAKEKSTKRYGAIRRASNVGMLGKLVTPAKQQMPFPTQVQFNALGSEVGEVLELAEQLRYASHARRGSFNLPNRPATTVRLHRASQTTVAPPSPP